VILSAFVRGLTLALGALAQVGDRKFCSGASPDARAETPPVFFNTPVI
jgi:hypothetical protein